MLPCQMIIDVKVMSLKEKAIQALRSISFTNVKRRLWQKTTSNHKQKKHDKNRTKTLIAHEVYT